MAYRIEMNEPLADGVVRVASEELRHALRRLRVADPDHREGIHEARKSFKKIRGLLRLIRYQPGIDYRRENRCFREMGRLLAPARDAEALLECTDQFASGDESPAEFAQLRTFLETRRDQILHTDLDMRKRLMVVASELQASRRRVNEWYVEGEGFAPLRAGFEKAYRQARREYRSTARGATNENMHEWRKRSKNTWYHARLLSSFWRGEANAYLEGLRELNDILGAHHDLAVLWLTLRQEGRKFLSEAGQRRLQLHLRAQQVDLERQANPLGRQLLTRPPDVMGWGVQTAYDAALAARAPDASRAEHAGVESLAPERPSKPISDAASHRHRTS